MSKEYDIDSDFIKYLIAIIGKENTQKKEIDLYLLNRLLRVLENTEREPSEGHEVVKQLEEDVENIAFCKVYYPYIRFFRGRGDDQVEIYEPVYQDVKLSDSDAVCLVGEFYRSLGEEYYENFIDFADDAKDHLKFINPNSDNEGETTFLDSTDEFFCIVPDYSNLAKATILVHETTHIFDWYCRPEFIKEYLVCEFNALFKEMIASDFIANKLELGNDNMKRRYYIHSLVKRDADDIYYRMQILHLFKNGNIRHDIGRIYAIFGIDYVKYLAQDSIISNYVYQVAYLIAIELYNIYQSDKKKALWIAKYLVQHANNTNIRGSLLKNGIVLNKHSIEYENELKLVLKK